LGVGPDLDGAIGQGTTVDFTFPSRGTRTITATATNGAGDVRSASGDSYEWRAYGTSDAYTVIASGTVPSTRGGARFIPAHEWATGLEHEFQTNDLRFVVNGDVTS
jgi:hypothetical protein